MDLNLISLNNIKVLSEFNKKDNFLNCKNKIILESVKKDDTFEGISELVDMEYALFFSFHHLLNIPTKYIIEDYTRKDIINMMIDAITNIYDIYETSIFEPENIRFYQMIENIDEIVFNAKINYKKHKCYFVMVDMFDYLCTGFKAFHELSIDFNSQMSGFNFNSDSDSDSEDSDNDPSPNVSPDVSDNEKEDENESSDNEDENESSDNESDDSNKSNKRQKLE